jgi:putative peptidoglycan lipid II flippase
MLGTVQLVWQRLQSRLHGTLLNSLIVMGGYLLSRITGLLRDIAIAYQFGTSASLGAYYAAFRITDLLYMVVIGGALGSSFIPVFIQTWDRAGERRAWQLASAVMNWALLVLALASALLWLLAPWLTAQFYSGPDVSAQQLALTSDLTRLFLLSPLLLGLGGLAMAVLNAHNRFTLPALAPATYNLGIIGGALLLAPLLGIWGLAWGVVLGAAIYLLLQLPGLWRLGMALTLTLGRGFDMALRRDLGSIAVQMAPRVIGQAASQISLLVTAALTTSLALGLQRLAGLNYAYQLMLLPYGIFSLSLSTVAFPQLARLFAAGEHDELCERVRRTLRMILFLTLPAAVALIVLAVPLVRVLYQWGGAFDQTSLLYTTVPLLAYATALPAFAASEILIRSFYAMQKTWIPVLIGLLQVGLNLALGTLALSMGGGVGMLALAFSIANNVEALLLVVLLGRRANLALDRRGSTG